MPGIGEYNRKSEGLHKVVDIYDALKDIEDRLEGEEFTDLMLRASIESKGYYKVCEDCYYIAKGNVCDVFRILEIDDSLLILEFYKID